MNKKQPLLFLVCTLIFGVSFFAFHTNTQLESKGPADILGITITTTPTPTTTIISEILPTPETTHVLIETTIIPTVVSPSVIAPSVLNTTITSPTVTSTESGSVTKITYKTLTKGTIYKFDVSQYPNASIMAFKWPRNSYLTWSNHAPIASSFVYLPMDEEGQTMQEKFSYSGLLDVPTGKVFYVMPQQTVESFVIALLNPSEGIESSFATMATNAMYNPDSGASYTSLPIKTRDEWGANTPTWDSNSSAPIDDVSRLIWYPVYYKAARIIVHHTATTPNTTDPAAAVRSVYLYHAYVRDTDGWGDIGYNYLIDQNGTIYEGKLGGDETLGYHAFGSANQTSIGISLIGDFTYVRPSTAQQTALIKLLAEKAAFYGFPLKYSNGSVNFWKDSSYTVFGHRDSYKWNNPGWIMNSTACPGNSFYPLLGTIVASAENYRQNNYAQIKQVVNEVNESFAAPHQQGVIVVKYNYPDTVAPSTIEALLPKYSGITSYTIDGNTVTIPITSSIVVHPFYGDSEYLVPPMGWTGYYNEFATFTPAFVLNGPEDRAKTLLKIFKLDPRVVAADVIHTLETQQQ